MDSGKTSKDVIIAMLKDYPSAFKDAQRLRVDAESIIRKLPYDKNNRLLHTAASRRADGAAREAGEKGSKLLARILRLPASEDPRLRCKIIKAYVGNYYLRLQNSKRNATHIRCAWLKHMSMSRPVHGGGGCYLKASAIHLALGERIETGNLDLAEVGGFIKSEGDTGPRRSYLPKGRMP